MADIKALMALARSFEDVTQFMHFDKCAFRVGKKIFVTVNAGEQSITVKLSAADQSVFSLFDPSVIYPVPGSWGKHGWTIIELAKIKKPMLMDILTCSYCCVAPKSLAKKCQP